MGRAELRKSERLK
jgi:16S rRNA C967 or C1407 C5-methylase (RsmB/RsmF family)